MEKTIVMIHGMWGGGWYWEKFKHYFEEKGYRCHTPTLRYHDMDPKEKPDPGLDTTSLIDYAQDLQKYIQNLDERPLLIGHSMGGLLAQILGTRGLANSLVLLTPASVVRKVAKKYKAVSKYKEFEKHAHWVIGEPGWETIAEFVYNWINKTKM